MNFVVFFLIAIFCSLSGLAQNRPVVNGSVKNEYGTPLEGVTITVLPNGRTTVSTAAGEFALRNLSPGKKNIRFSSVGYFTVDSTVLLERDKGVITIDVILLPAQNMLGEVSVSAPINTPGEVRRLGDVHQTYIIAGKKNEVVNVEGMNANLAEKTGRQLFAKIPGVFVYDMDGSGNQMNISTRGLDPHRSWEYNVRLNGVMTNSDIYGYPASHYSAPMESISRIELVRGTASLQYGAQIGGMINYITKGADTTKKISFESINSAGSYGLLSTYNAVGGRSGRFTYYGYYSRRVSEGYRNNARSDYSAQFGSLSYRLSDQMDLKAEVANMSYVYRIPGPLTDEQFRQNPRQSTRERNYFNPNITVPSLGLDWRISTKTRINWTTSAVLGKRNSLQFLNFATVRDTINPATGSQAPRQIDIDGFNSYSSELRLVHSFFTRKVANTISTGLRYTDNDLHRRQLGRGTSGKDFDLSLIDPLWGRDLRYKTRNIAFYAENLIKVTDQLSVTPGIRYEMGATNMMGTIRNIDPGDVPNRIRHHFALLGIGAQYTFSNNLQLYGGWSQAYRPVIFSDIIPPTPLDRTDKNLKDAKGYNAELGFRSRSLGWVSYDLSLFALQYSNRIGSIVVTENGSNYIFKTNLGSSITKGAEVFLEVRPLMLMRRVNDKLRLSLFTSTSYFDAYYLQGNVVFGGANKSITNNRLETVPHWISRNGVNFGYNQFSATLQHSFVSESYSDALNTPVPTANGSAGPVPSYTLWDLNTTYKVSPLVSIKLGVNNIINRQYFTKRPTGYPGPGVWPSDGRSIVGTMVIKL